MKIKLDTLNLLETLKYFYMLTGIRTVIFDAAFQEVFAYPENPCNFCMSILASEELREKCYKSDEEAFAKCKETENMHIYKCHAGLVEAAMPIKNENKVIGYMMLGQITDIKDKKGLKDLEGEIFDKFGIKCNTSEIKYKNKNQILAATKLLEICTDYMILKEMIEEENEKISIAAKTYIDEHLSEEISIYDLCDYVGTSRTKLYETFKKDCDIGIAAYIKEKRLATARRLLKSTDLSVSVVSAKVGFYDYNYFSRVYKQKYGVSPHRDR